MIHLKKHAGHVLGGLCVALIGFSGPAQAIPTLTAAAVTAGFGLSVFVDEIPHPFSTVGPVGIMNTPGGILITGYGDAGNIKTFADVDGQHWGAVAPSFSQGYHDPTGVATVGGKYYMALQSEHKVIETTATGVPTGVTVASISFATGLVANPVTGHLYVSNVSGVYEVDPVGMTTTLISGFDADGMTLSADGATLYMAIYGSDGGAQHVVGISTGPGHATTFDSGVVGTGSEGIDGSALGTGSLAGKLYVNTNSGKLIEINMVTLAQTTLFSGGSRGDFVWVDSTTGTLLITQSSEVLRLTAPVGGGFEGGDAVPEPASLVLLGLGLLGAARRRKIA